jgi:histidinol-phosphate phosphatase family protein
MAILDYIISKCLEYGFIDIKILLCFESDVIKKQIGDGEKFGVKIEYFIEEFPLGTAGALAEIAPNLCDQFLVLYADTFFDIDLNEMWNFHNQKLADISIFLHPNDHPYDSDLVEANLSNKVTKIHAYPHNKVWKRNLVNAAMYVFNKNVFNNYRSTDKVTDIAKNLLPEMIEQRKEIYGYISTEYIKDMGTPERLLCVESDIKSGKVKRLRRSSLKPTIFIDRDGTINKEVGHLSDINDFELLPGVSCAIRKINRAGILCVVITNQPVIARGDLTLSKLTEIHKKMDTLLGNEGAYIDRLYYCPHHPHIGYAGEIKALKFECSCRKPNIGMLQKACTELGIDYKNSWMIGDSTSDIQAARNFGLRSVLVGTGHAGRDHKYKVSPDLIADNLEAAVKLILNVRKE